MRISKNSLLYALEIVILCEPQLLTYNYYIDSMFKFGKIIIFIFVIFYLLSSIGKRKFGKETAALLVYELVLLISTIVNGLSIYYCILYGMTFISITVLTEREMRRNTTNCIKTLLIIFTIFVIIHILTYICNFSYAANGTQYYFLGLRTRTTDSVVIIIACAFLLYSLKKIKFFITLVFLLIGLMAELIFSVSTGLTGLGIILVVYFGIKIGVLRKIFENKNIIIILAIAVILVVIFRVQDVFNPIFEVLFNKGADLSYRTYIWDNAIKEYIKSPLSIIIGNGVTELGEWVPFGGRMWQSHDQYLQVLLDGGFIALGAFIIMFVKWVQTILKYRNTKIAAFSSAFLVGYALIMIAEIYSYYPQFYLILALFSNIDLYNNKDLSLKV